MAIPRHRSDNRVDAYRLGDRRGPTTSQRITCLFAGRVGAGPSGVASFLSGLLGGLSGFGLGLGCGLLGLLIQRPRLAE